MQENHFFLLKKFKNTESAQLWGPICTTTAMGSSAVLFRKGPKSTLGGLRGSPTSERGPRALSIDD